MRTQHTATPPMAGRENAEPVLRGRWLLLARTGWAALVTLNLGLFVVAIPAVYAQHGGPPEDVLAGLARLGIPEGLYALYVTVLLAAFGLGCFVVAAGISWRRPTDPVALFVSLFLVLLGGPNHPNVQALAAAYPALDPLLKLSWGFLGASLILFVFLFPDGRFVSRWMRVPVGLLVVGTFIALFFGRGSLAEPSDALGLVLITALLGGTATQIHRYRRVSNRAQRQQTKWVVFGVTVAVVAQVGTILAAPLLAGPGLPALLYSAASVNIVTFAFILVPLSIGVAILRYRLWDIDLVINRTLVYGALTAIVAGLYVLVVGGLGALLQTRGSLLFSLLGAGLVAVLFAPLRDRLQRSVNRLMYGERDAPYEAVSQLGQRLESTLAPAAVLPAVARTVKEALKLPYAAIEVERNGGFEAAAVAGAPVDAPVHLPLVYGGKTVGRLALGLRYGEASFSPQDRRLMEELARQAGVAVHAVRLAEEAVRLSEDLQHSRERLVTAREEERRRLRRDLHDGLGPRLAGLTMRAEAARDLIPEDPAHAESILGDLMEQAQDAVTDIRRVAHGLRPPALDALGLVGALRSHASGLDTAGLRAKVEAPDELPPLPAAVEVAAYRIATEALNNVARHAGARNCAVHLEFDTMSGMLSLEITDDGRGIAQEDRGLGVGLSSMRERAEELGGACVVESLPSGGTCVRARLPCRQEDAATVPKPGEG